MNSLGRWVVVNAAGEFWTGRGWSAEYPDAEVYSRRAQLTGFYPYGEVEAYAVKNYGYDNETRKPLRVRVPEPKDRFVIVGFDPDQRQTFWDVIEAPTREAAEERWERVRDAYAFRVETLEVSELERLAQSIKGKSSREVEADFSALETLLAMGLGDGDELGSLSRLASRLTPAPVPERSR